jgi:formate hydrogenlyase transcriptional activator
MCPSGEPFRLGSHSDHRTLAEISGAIVSHKTLAELLHVLTDRLRPLVNFDYLSIVLHDAEHDQMVVHDLETSGPGAQWVGSALPVEDSPSGWVWQSQKCLAVADIAADSRFPEVWKRLVEAGLRSFCSLPLTTPRRRLGAMNFGYSQVGAYTEQAVSIQQLVAAQVAVAVENALNYEAAQKLQDQLTRERDRLRLLLDVNNAVVSNLDLPQLFHAIPASVRRAMQCDAAYLSLPDTDKRELHVHGLDFPESRGFMQEEMAIPIANTSSGQAFLTGEPVYWGSPPQDIAPIAMQKNALEGFQSACFIPITRKARKLGVLHVLDRRANYFSEEVVEFLVQVASQVAIALENALEFSDVSESRERLAKERLYLLDEIRSEHRFQEVIGSSAPLRKVLSQLETVAPTDSTVLIYGETGTGKELIARAIHNLSSRKDRTFVKLNCAAIPLGLLESELFGHEKGAFTGAIERKAGRFELANKGTLFLDEVGDIPLELQPKLLRVLQEQEFERLGSTRSIKVDVRLVAATNRPLGKMVEERHFRADLYYRLNVFPLALPPLRERRDDIPDLVRFFVERYAQQMNKKITTVPKHAMEALVNYDWPGNIRELQNFVERAVILSPDQVLQAPVGELKSASGKTRATGQNGVALADAEREHILEALRSTNWVLGGSDGAAARLGVPRTTLLYKMRRLGIPRQQG